MTPVSQKKRPAHVPGDSRPSKRQNRVPVDPSLVPASPDDGEPESFESDHSDDEFDISRFPQNLPSFNMVDDSLNIGELTSWLLLL